MSNTEMSSKRTGEVLHTIMGQILMSLWGRGGEPPWTPLAAPLIDNSRLIKMMTLGMVNGEDPEKMKQ